MRGRKAGHRCALRLPAAAIAAGQDRMRVLSDMDEAFPVSPGELDAIDSFLGPLIETLLKLPCADSEAPHSSVIERRSIAGEESCEVFVEDLV